MFKGIMTVLLAISVLAASAPTTAGREQAVVTKITLTEKCVTTPSIELSGRNFTSVEKTAAEGHMFLIVPLALTFSQAKTPVYFDQIAVVDKQGTRIAPAYFTIGYNVEKMKADLPCMVAGQGSGEFYRRDETKPAEENALRSAFGYFVQRGSDGAPDRWGLLFSPESEKTVFVFEVAKTFVGDHVVVGEASAKLKKIAGK